MPLARLAVGDVERWHTRLRQAGMGNAGVKNQHGVLRTALAQAVRWGSINRNVAGMARLRSTKQKRRTVMTLDEVRAVMAGAESIDPAAALMLRVAAVSGARRAELTALRWDDLHASCSRSTRPSRSSRAATASASPRRIDEDG